MLDVTYQRSFIQDQDIAPDQRFLVNFALKYLGTYQVATDASACSAQVVPTATIRDGAMSMRPALLRSESAGIRMPRLAALLAALLLALFLVGGANRGTAQEVSIKVLVNDDPISDYDIDQRMRFLAITEQSQPSPELKQKAVDMLIEERLQMQEGRRQGVSPDDDEVNKILGDMAKKNNLDVDGLTTALGKTGVNIKTLKDRIRSQLVWQETVRTKFRHDVQIGDADITAAMTRVRHRGWNRPRDPG